MGEYYEGDPLKTLIHCGSYYPVNWKLMKFINSHDDMREKKIEHLIKYLKKQRSKGENHLTDEEIRTRAESQLRNLGEGVDEAIIFGYLCALQQYHNENNKSYLEKHGGMFFCTAETMRKMTLIEPRRQRTAIDNLVCMELIETKNLGIPSKRHFKVNTDEMEEILMGIAHDVDVDMEET